MPLRPRPYHIQGFRATHMCLLLETHRLRVQTSMERVSEETKGSVKKRRAVGVSPNHPILFTCLRRGFFTSGYQLDHTLWVNIRDHTQRVKIWDHTQQVNVWDLTQRFNVREHTQRINIQDHTQRDHTQRDDLTDRTERDKQIPHEHTGFNESINRSHRNSTNFITHNIVLDDITSDVLINKPPCSKTNAAMLSTCKYMIQCVLQENA